MHGAVCEVRKSKMILCRHEACDLVLTADPGLTYEGIARGILTGTVSLDPDRRVMTVTASFGF